MPAFWEYGNGNENGIGNGSESGSGNGNGNGRWRRWLLFSQSPPTLLTAIAKQRSSSGEGSGK